MKIYTLLAAALTISISQSFCSPKQDENVSENVTTEKRIIMSNWTKEQKESVLLISRSSAKANENVSVNKHAEEIAQEVLSQCISLHPNYEEFSKRSWYEVYKKASKAYLKN